MVQSLEPATDGPVPSLAAVEARREAILAAARRRRIAQVAVIGSVASGADDPHDLDLLVVLEEDADYFDLGGFWMDMAALFGCPLDVVDAGGLRASTLAAMEATAVVL